MKKIHYTSLRVTALAPGIRIEESRTIFAARGSCLIMESSFARSISQIHFQPLYGEELKVAKVVHEMGKAIRYEPTLGVIHRSHSSTGSLKSEYVRKLQFEGLKAYWKSFRPQPYGW